MQDGNTVGTDRLGSVRSGGSAALSYFPNGEERTGTANGQEKFGTYFRDADGNDYAMARRYSSAGGRFMTADPLGMKAARPRIPTRWNRMMYAGGDPINFWDRSGGIMQYAGTSCDVVDDDPDDIDGEDAAWDCEDYYSGGGPYAPDTPSDVQAGGGAPIAIPIGAPQCAQNQALAQQALNNIVTAVGQVLSASNQFTQAQIGLIESDLTANETSASDVGFVGGHFNLVLTGSQISQLDPTGSVGAALNGLFVGGTDGFGLRRSRPFCERPTPRHV